MTESPSRNTLGAAASAIGAGRTESNETSANTAANAAARRISAVHDMPQDLLERGIGIGPHLVVRAVLDRMGSEHSGHRGEAERLRLRLSGLNELSRGHEYGRDAPPLEIDDVVHTARRATASIGERFDDDVALRRDLVPQIDRRRLRERRLGVAFDAHPQLRQALLDAIEEPVTPRFADVEQPDR